MYILLALNPVLYILEFPQCDRRLTDQQGNIYSPHSPVPFILVFPHCGAPSRPTMEFIPCTQLSSMHSSVSALWGAYQTNKGVYPRTQSCSKHSIVSALRRAPHRSTKEYSLRHTQSCSIHYCVSASQWAPHRPTKEYSLPPALIPVLYVLVFACCVWCLTDQQYSLPFYTF